VRQETGRLPDRADRGRRGGWLLGPPTLAGVAVALLFWWWSLDPSMLPRSWYARGAVSGLSAAIGYLLGTLAGYGVGALLRRLGREPTPAARRRAWLVLGVAGAVVVVAGLALWPGWQNQQRAMVGMERLPATALGPMVALTLLLFGLLLLVGRLVGHAIALFDRLLARRLPRMAAHALTAAVFVVAAVVVSRDVVVVGFLDWANRSFGAADTTTAPGVVAPTTPTASGSPASLVPWPALGEYGRSFVAGATTPAQLRAFHGKAAEVKQPIRVYAGLRSAGSPDEQAALAVRELERTGVFSREILGVITTTGTGWVDPDAASSVEYLHAGDTALVGLQYSYLPSWISFLVDKEEAAEAGVALYRHVHQRWSQLPADRRPRLIVFGRALAPSAPRPPSGAATPPGRWPTWSPGRTGRCSPAPPPPTPSGTSSPPTWSAPTPAGGIPGSCTCTTPRTRSGTRPWRRSGGGRRGPTGRRATTSPPGPAGTRWSPGSRRSST
jgi:uncharacterized membrane protein